MCTGSIAMSDFPDKNHWFRIKMSFVSSGLGFARNALRRPPNRPPAGRTQTVRRIPWRSSSRDTKTAPPAPTSGALGRESEQNVVHWRVLCENKWYQRCLPFLTAAILSMKDWYCPGGTHSSIETSTSCSSKCCPA